MAAICMSLGIGDGLREDIVGIILRNIQMMESYSVSIERYQFVRKLP